MRAFHVLIHRTGRPPAEISLQLTPAEDILARAEAVFGLWPEAIRIEVFGDGALILTLDGGRSRPGPTIRPS
ncbi:MAG: hypothetical protein EBR82_37640 [Caulobacteraceae bacterium]|nr:hypothetical protein [Caulobacteraceae bacterium]